MNRPDYKLGLVLSGGGARGAYEVGVAKALAKYGLEPDVISGASIGALNGAVIASSPNISAAAEALDKLWKELDRCKILKLKSDILLKYFVMLVLNILFMQLEAHSARFSPPKKTILPFIMKTLFKEDAQCVALLDESPVREILEKNLDIHKLYDKDFYISLFPSSEFTGFGGLAADLADYFFSLRRSEFIRVRDYPPDKIIGIIQASSSLPVAFKPCSIDGRNYRDGGMGDKLRQQGNVPIEPLIKSGCTDAVVAIIGEGSLWNRYDWPGINILEIEPSKSIREEGSVESLLNFSKEKIEYLIELGEYDTIRQISKVKKFTEQVNSVRNGRQVLEAKLQGLKDQDEAFARSKEMLDNLAKGKI